MTASAVPRGAFVDCFFPFAEKPAIPGPMPHIAYVQTMLHLKNGEHRLLAMFTTTSPRIIDSIPPALKIRIPETSSRQMGMRNSFVIDIHRLALLPLTAEWFPEIGTSRFVIGIADSHLRAAITKRYDEMLSRQPPPFSVSGPH